MKTAKTLLKYGGDVLASPRWREEKRFPHHGSVSCYLHSVRVADRAVRIARFLKRYFGFGTDMKALVRGALLHDFYLYDWHVPDKAHPHKLHGFHHPRKAMENAEAEFSLSAREKAAILTHMFPLTPTFPSCREAWIICVADKICSTEEIFCGLTKKKIPLEDEINELG